MRGLFAVFAFLSMLTAGFAAYAAEVTGTVSSIDVDARLLMLDDGTLFEVVDPAQLDGVGPGASVTVVFDATDDGRRIATEVKPAG